jgi:aminopeptidase N
MYGKQVMAASEPCRLEDYAAYPFLVDHVDMRVELGGEGTRIYCALSMRRRDDCADAVLELNGEDLLTESVLLDGVDVPLHRCLDSPGILRLSGMADTFRLETVVVIDPSSNQRDEGLMLLGAKLATHCEPEGFRRITWFPDRPDILARYTVTLVGDPRHYPVMLSNGQPVARGCYDDGRHWVCWEDPICKPCYIFALVAGDFACLSAEHVTPSGRRITLQIFADHERAGECEFAMGALQRALRWEEEQYGLEYDLEVYNVVALTGYGGAMENKGLNIFSADGICVDQDISTDADYAVVERILAHEVFHNWTGNRVTCRDWFQLSLKEGLTRFRDQCFSRDMSSPAVKRIEFVKTLQRNQFPEDESPAAHPIKPVQYFQIRNFYTATIYEKGAEVIRMMSCLLGAEAFREAIRFYLYRHDQQAVTTEDFLSAVADYSGRDLSQFSRWYRQVGRPIIHAQGEYDSASGRYVLTLEQRPASPADAGNYPLHIPIVAGFVGPEGEALTPASDDAVQVDGSYLLELRENRQRFTFHCLGKKPLPSLLRGFSAPVSLQVDVDSSELMLLAEHDEDPFNRWQAGQTLATRLIRELAADWHAGRPLVVEADFIDSWSRQLEDDSTDPALVAELLSLPDEPALSEGLPHIDLDGHMAARDVLRSVLARRNRDLLLQRYRQLSPAAKSCYEPLQVAQRSLRNRCLEALLATGDVEARELCLAQVRQADNMTDQLSALAMLCHLDCDERNEGLQVFYQRWQHKPSVIDKWFNVQALSQRSAALDDFLLLEQHSAMDIMNVPRAMAFYGAFFRQNRVAFNHPSGKGYQLLAERLVLIDSIKPGSTYWLMPQILQWRRFDGHRRQLMKEALASILKADVSMGLYETVSQALAEEEFS